VDAGNIDFLNHGYGGERAIMVNPASVGEVKSHMRDEAINVRL